MLAVILIGSFGVFRKDPPAQGIVAHPEPVTISPSESTDLPVTQGSIDGNRFHVTHPVQAPAQASSQDDAQRLASQVSQLLLDYQSPELEPEEKQFVQDFLREISGTAEGRALISKLFFSADDPQIAQSMYDLILDADLKDPTLIVALIERDRTEFNVDCKRRLVDLIADQTTREQNPYRVEIEGFLADMAVHPDPQLKAAALAQWAWYVSHYKGILPVLDAYLFAHAKQAREEIYEIIESGAVVDAAEKREVALALDALTYADYLKVDAAELKKVRQLIDQLSMQGS